MACSWDSGCFPDLAWRTPGLILSWVQLFPIVPAVTVELKSLQSRPFSHPERNECLYTCDRASVQYALNSHRCFEQGWTKRGKLKVEVDSDGKTYSHFHQSQRYDPHKHSPSQLQITQSE